MRQRKVAGISALLLIFFTVFSIYDGRLANRKHEISDAKREFRELRSFNRDLNSLETLRIMTEIDVPRPPFDFLMKPWEAKEEKLEDASLSMIVMIKSHVENQSRRQFIRETWSLRNQIEDLAFVVVFVLGTSSASQNSRVMSENEAYGDILQINYNETYENLVFKTLAGMQWVTDNFPRSWFYASMDDDVLPDLRKISVHLHEIIETELDLCHRDGDQVSNNESLPNRGFDGLDFFLASHDFPIYCGFGYRVKTRPKRTGVSKWGLSKEEYPLKRYPPYCFGGFYAMTVSLASKFYSLSQKLPLFWIDDVWVTGFLRVKYFSTAVSSCHYCNKKNMTFGIWTEVPSNFAGAVTGNMEFLEKEWAKMSDGHSMSHF